MLHHKYSQDYLQIFLSGIILFSISCTPVNESFEELNEESLLQEPLDAIIVPGIPYRLNEMDDVMIIRVYWAKYLYDKGYARNIIFSGAAVHSPYIEGKIMASFGSALGIPKENIYIESLAEHSTENIFYSNLIARKVGFDKIALASDPFQSTFLRHFRDKYYPHIFMVPVDFQILNNIQKPVPSIDASSAYQENFISLTDRKGWIGRIMGSMGYDIDHSITSYPDSVSIQ